MRLSRRAGWALGGGALLLAVGATVALFHFHQSPVASGPAGWPVLPRKVTVEVLNATRSAGMARVATAQLRRARLDVVYFGNADNALGRHDRTEVLVRRGDTIGVGRVLETLGPAAVIDAPDSTRLVDLTVLLGTDYLRAHAPPHP